MASSSSKKRDVAFSSLGRKVYVSQRGLESVLKELKEAGHLADEMTSSRRSIKRAREEDLASRTTTYGPLIQEMELAREDGSGTIKVPYVAPAAFLAHIAQQASFGGFLAQKLEEQPSTHQAPWHLCLYADEITPGNALKPTNWRRQQAIYWSFKNFGAEGLSSETLWMPLCCLRSHLCAALGGLTVLWKHMVKTFFGEPHDMRRGIFLQTPSGKKMLFARLAILVADEAAIKHSLENKGAAGTIFCVRCSNVVPHRSGLSEVSNDIVSSLCLDVSRFRLHTNATTRSLIEHLQEQSHVLSKSRFAELEKALDFNYKAEGLLLDDDVGYSVPEAIMYDRLHVYLVHGIAGNQVGCLLGSLRDAGFSESRVSDFLNTLTWPAQFAGSKPTAILLQKRETKNSPLKGSASEQLNFFPALRLFILLFVAENMPANLQQPCRCFFLLCKVLELLQQVTRGERVEPATLHDAIVEHSRCLLETHGAQAWVPKNHMALHLAEFLKIHGCLLSCFVHERKHKVLKRFSNQMNTAVSFETTLLKDVLAVQLEALTHELPNQEVRLLQKRDAGKTLRELVQGSLQSQAAVFQAAKAVHGGGFQCSPGDVVTMQLQDGAHVGRIEFLVECEGRPMACVSEWEHVHGYMYRVQQAQSMLVHLACITASCIFSQREQQAIVALP